MHDHVPRHGAECEKKCGGKSGLCGFCGYDGLCCKKSKEGEEQDALCKKKAASDLTDDLRCVIQAGAQADKGSESGGTTSIGAGTGR